MLWPEVVGEYPAIPLRSLGRLINRREPMVRRRSLMPVGVPMASDSRSSSSKRLSPHLSVAYQLAELGRVSQFLSRAEYRERLHRILESLDPPSDPGKTRPKVPSA